MLQRYAALVPLLQSMPNTQIACPVGGEVPPANHLLRAHTSHGARQELHTALHVRKSFISEDSRASAQDEDEDQLFCISFTGTFESVESASRSTLKNIRTG